MKVNNQHAHCSACILKVFWYKIYLFSCCSGSYYFSFFFRLWTVCCAWLYRTIFAVLVVQRMHIYVDIWITLCVEWWCYCTVVALLLLRRSQNAVSPQIEHLNRFVTTLFKHITYMNVVNVYINTTGRRGFIKCSSIINFVDYFYFFIFSIRLDGVVEGTDHVEDISTFEIPQNIYTETRSICVAV